jgi:hypothetical protein
MMNCEKHLTITITNIILFSVILATAGCSKENSKKDFIARVNETYLTREDFASLVDTTNLNPEQKDRIIKEWVYNEILFQQAVKDGITDEDEFKKILSNSKKQLASAMLLENYSLDQELNINDEELFGYYDKNKNYFISTSNAFLLNRVYFTDEEKAIRFRNNAINSDWANAVNIFSEDSSINKSYTFALIDEYSIYPNQLNKIIIDLYPQEISIVITEKPGYYSIVQMIKKISKNSILPFELIKSDVKKKLLAEKKNQIIKDYLKELYSQNEIEIKK